MSYDTLKFHLMAVGLPYLMTVNLLYLMAVGLSYLMTVGLPHPWQEVYHIHERRPITSMAEGLPYLISHPWQEA